MCRSQKTYNKKKKEKKRLKKRKEKAEKKEERKANSVGGALEDMMVYVDEFGNLTDTPPDPTAKKEEIKAESIEIGIPRQEDIPDDPVKKGKVDFFDDTKGFGFIHEEGTRERYFVHANGLIDKIQDGDLVSFELEQGMKGLNCVNVKLKAK